MCYRKDSEERRLHGVSEYIGAILSDVICWQVTAADGATGALDDGRCSFEVKIAASDRIGRQRILPCRLVSHSGSPNLSY